MASDQERPSSTRSAARRVGAVLCGLVLVAWAAWMLAGDPPGTFGRIAVTAPPPGTPERVEVTVTAALHGAIADHLAVSVDHMPERVRVGDPLLTWAALQLRTTGGRTVELPLHDTATSGAPTDGWTIDSDSGAGVQLVAPMTIEVIAASDPSTVGVVERHEVVPGVPRLLEMSVALPELPAEAASWVVEVPFGDGALVVTVHSTDPEPGDPTAQPVRPNPDIAGTTLAVPPEGEARSVVLEDGTPLWITHTRANGVHVVDARSSFPTRAATPLVAWCGAGESFVVDQHGESYASDGTLIGGPVMFGLTTYHGEVVDGRYRLGAGVPGAPKEPRHLVQVGGGFVIETQTVAASPCTRTGPPAPSVGSSTPVDTGDLPTSPVGLLSTTRRPSLVEGRLLLDEDGRGQLCESGGADGWTCTGDRVAVDVSRARGPDASLDPSAAQPLGQDGPFVVAAMADGVITSLWQTGRTVAESRADERYATAGRFVAFADDEALLEDCRRRHPGCRGEVRYLHLNLLGEDGWFEPVRRDGVLPRPYWLITGAATQRHWETVLLDDITGVRSLVPGDLILVHDGWGSGPSTVEPLQLPE
ncbi:hypothetical protein DVS28_a1908 [Euzebya pacifica]|uniref:Uncharacterized protein n=2 Tax=Euzebya pacifica TaxID=1608957 RepID=A0A346XWJ6_9ACTN|nr:hypothetical protein DVS28_a1908 [Euzebya pacifica]